MTPGAPVPVVFCLLSILLIPLTAAGLTLVNTGLTRSRSTAHVVLASLCAAALAVLVFTICGFSFTGFSGQAAHAIVISGKPWDWLGAGRLFARSAVFDEASVQSGGALILLFQLFSVSLAALIPVATGAERWRLAGVCASTAVLAGITFPLLAHWVWAGGWLAQLGKNYGLGRGFVDGGGAACTQSVGGLSALAIAWILGPRQGKFTSDGIPTAMPGHNAVFVLFGCTLALAGWLGLNASGALLFAGANIGQAALSAVNTVLCAAAGAIAALITTRIRFGKPDASLTANGWVAGLVASSASAAFVKPASAMLIGLVIGALVVFAIEVVEVRMRVDDPAGAIAVHAVGGVWGLLALGMFGNFPADAGGQFLAQLVGVATLIGFILPLSYGANLLIDRFLPQRVTASGERQGMDLFELGAGAYPEFVTHREDFMRR